MKRVFKTVTVAVLAMALVAPLHAEGKRHRKTHGAEAAEKPARAPRRLLPQGPPAVSRDGQAEARLIDIYKLIGQARVREALGLAEGLVQDHPDFQLAQLVYGDLLAAQSRPVRMPGDVPDTAVRASGTLLGELRSESLLRLKALRERPAPGLVPSQFLSLSANNRHAIAVDASRSRLYLFENLPAGLRLVSDFYISIGKSGIEKKVEGDLRTPLGIYFITSNLDRRSLKDFYGSGALPVNYPNQLDIKRGKTGGGIWLHGTPPGQFARAPLATDGCVVLANPDLERIIDTVEIRTTPVVIASSLKWVAPQAVKDDGRPFEEALKSWHAARSSGDFARIAGWYAPDFLSNGKSLADWMQSLRGEVDRQAGRQIELKDVSYLRWTDSADTMVVTFGELVQGARSGHVKRQYWSRQGNQWKIFYEGIIG